MYLLFFQKIRWNFTCIEEINVQTFITEHDVRLDGKVSKVEKFRFLQTCHSYNESATVVSFLALVVNRALVVLVYYWLIHWSWIKPTIQVAPALSHFWVMLRHLRWEIITSGAEIWLLAVTTILVTISLEQCTFIKLLIGNSNKDRLWNIVQPQYSTHNLSVSDNKQIFIIVQDFINI